MSDHHFGDQMSDHHFGGQMSDHHAGGQVSTATQTARCPTTRLGGQTPDHRFGGWFDHHHSGVFLAGIYREIPAKNRPEWCTRGRPVPGCVPRALASPAATTT
ncbi:hypothetical protein NWFMUON74_34080 [Nocardia wallacei]|uniref:Uncharacterized protein n=1 Tax=Nocardia wallacei TaxID=480035 RepID=A0A7G1KM26_9NOCA|nr:hypothetical protein NWFMUON74_34080 [Nocardia wallacei]